jgi:hypothetical protein
MRDEDRKQLTEEELDALNAELLPDREEMTVIQPISPIGGGHTLPIEPPETE